MPWAGIPQNPKNHNNANMCEAMIGAEHGCVGLEIIVYFVF
jgi:hypothetical protein